MRNHGEMSSGNSNYFNSLSSKIGNLLYLRTEKDRQNLHKTLDELISITCRYPVVINPMKKAILLVNQCCTLIPSDDAVLVHKCSQLIRNLIHNQSIAIEGKTLTLAVNWCMSGLRTSNTNVLLDILKALEALLRCDIKNLKLLFGNIIKDLRSLVAFQDEKFPEINLFILECLEACTTPIREIGSENKEQLEICAQIFLKKLYEKHNHDDFLSVKTLQICLFGLQNVVNQHPEFLRCELGNLLGIIKSFMLYGIKDIDFLEPTKVLPSILSVPEPTAYIREKKAGKLTKLRKQRSSGVHKKKERQSEDCVFNNTNVGYTPANTGLAVNAGENSTGAANRSVISDSDFSDNESGRNSKILRMQGRVRQATHNLFYDVVKNTEKSVFFSYWSNFIPDDFRSGQHNLITCILKDSLAESRMAALNVLLLLLTSSKPFLIQAESSDKSTSFTPFSVVLGLMLNELHRGLCMALNEKVALVLTQVLKCFAALVQATPYHRMFPGLITKVVQNVKPILYNNKVASVQVTALIVLGCILASEPVLPEIEESMSRIYPTANNETDGGTEPTTEDTDSESEEIDDVEFVFDEEDTNNSTMPWLLQKCLDILVLRPGVKPEHYDQGNTTTPVPVKLESLQVISAMSASYFENLIAPYLGCITRAIKAPLSDKHADLRLHTGRAIDYIGQAIERYLTNRDPNTTIPFEDHLSFWQTLLDGPLVELIQCEDDPVLRTIGCDCLGSIGTDIFEKLPRDKQILCVTLLLSRSRDSENNVKAAAVRSLGMSVHYSPLKDDPGFIVDTTEAICSTLKVDYLLVRIKASWALGNLSDSLVLNRKLIEESEEISENFFLKLLETSISALSDNDKIKMNIVRALGNLIYLFDGEMLEKSRVVEASERAFEALVKCCSTSSNMKVRWNACHGIGNALKNPNIYNKPNSNWQKLVFDALAEVVVSFRNFKVRINAASALASPTARDQYGRFYFTVWTALLKALETCQHIGDFTEYKHRDNLIEQICLSLGHLTTLLLEEDLLQLQDTMYLYFDIFKFHSHKVSERLVPEKLTTLASASYALNRLGKSTSLTEGQKSVLNCLTDIFAPLS